MRSDKSKAYYELRMKNYKGTSHTGKPGFFTSGYGRASYGREDDKKYRSMSKRVLRISNTDLKIESITTKKKLVYLEKLGISKGRSFYHSWKQ